MSKSQEIRGWFISVNNDEEKIIEEALEEFDFQKSSDGVKDLLLYLLNEDESAPEENKLNSFFRENPQVAEGLGTLGKMGMDLIRKRAAR